MDQDKEEVEVVDKQTQVIELPESLVIYEVLITYGNGGELRFFASDEKLRIIQSMVHGIRLFPINFPRRVISLNPDRITYFEAHLIKNKKMLRKTKTRYIREVLEFGMSLKSTIPPQRPTR